MRAALILCGLVLVGCAEPMKVESATTDAVTITYLEGRRDEADKEAEKQCAAFSKRPKFRNLHDAGGRKFAIYDCVT